MFLGFMVFSVFRMFLEFSVVFRVQNHCSKETLSFTIYPHYGNSM